jgi:hypothetical protein
MLYNCQKVSLSKMILTTSGLVEPLCDKCQAVDCENPIENKMVAIAGINKMYKLYIHGNTPSAVVACEGYV